jgi:hypothetical protein
VKRKRQLKMCFIPHEEVSSALPIFCEPISLLELAVLRLSPVYYGLSVPAGDGSCVVIIPGLLGTDLVLLELHAWLSRLGYRPYFSGMGIAADCPHVARAAPGRHYQARVRGNQAPGAPGRPQLGRRIRPIRGCPHARPRRVGYHAGYAVSRTYRARRSAGVGQPSPPMDSAAVREPARMVQHQPVLVRVRPVPAPQMAFIGGADGALHPGRRDRRLALLPDRRPGIGRGGSGHAHRPHLQPGRLCVHRRAPVRETPQVHFKSMMLQRERPKTPSSRVFFNP